MAKKSTNSRASQQIAKAVERGTAGLISRSAPIAASIVKDKLESIILEIRPYQYFSDKTTVRKDPSAPNKVVGMKRDIVDSGLLYNSVEVEKRGRGANVEYDVLLNVPYANKINEQFDLTNALKNELNIN
jgi:hypothetical protein